MAWSDALWYEYIVIALAMYFAGGWALGLALSPRNRTGGNIVTVIVWWVGLTLVLAGTFAPLHLLWVFPVALLLPPLLLLLPLFARVLQVDDHRAILLEWFGVGRLKLGISVGGHTGFRVALPWQKQAFFNVVNALEAAGVKLAPDEPRFKRFAVDFADLLQDHPPSALSWRAFIETDPSEIAKGYL